MSKSTREIKELLIAAGREAAEDLMRIAKEKIMVSGKDPLAADKLVTPLPRKNYQYLTPSIFWTRCSSKKTS
jgi:hypothetical protein